MDEQKKKEVYRKLVLEVIKYTKKIIGNIAIVFAKSIPGIYIDGEIENLRIEGEGAKILLELVKKYKTNIGATAETIANRIFSEVTKDLSKEELEELKKELPEWVSSALVLRMKEVFE